MSDMSQTTKPKTDQLNFDDFIDGPRNIKITSVTIKQDPQQPVSVFFDGDNGKPYKPCLSMRRVMIKAWGNDSKEYVGKSMTLFGDTEVTFGKDKVGGIRISHMSHIDENIKMALTASKNRRATYNIGTLKVEEVKAIDESQVSLIQTLIEAAKADVIWICKNYNVGSIKEMSEDNFNDAKNGLQGRIDGMKNDTTDPT